MTAENPDESVKSSPSRSCFNEAAADDRGKRRAVPGAGRGHDRRGFNEAAADDRGKLVAVASSWDTRRPLQ